MSASQQKLGALIDSVGPLLPYTANDKCEALFDELCDFGAHLLSRQKEHQWLQRSSMTVLLSLPRIRKRQRADDDGADEHMTTADSKKAVVEVGADVPPEHFVYNENEDGIDDAVMEEDARVQGCDGFSPVASNCGLLDIPGVALEPLQKLSDIVDDNVLDVLDVMREQGDAQEVAHANDHERRVPIIALKLKRSVVVPAPVQQEKEHGLDDEAAVETMLCVCEKEYRNELVCDYCEQDFTWCCSGYEREPRANPIHAETGQEIGLSAFCGTCLEEQEFRPGVPMTAAHVLAQEDDYDALVRYFAAHTELKWIPDIYMRCPCVAGFNAASVLDIEVEQNEKLFVPQGSP